MDVNWILESPAAALPAGDKDATALSVDGDESVTYDQLRRLRNHYASMLLDLGVNKGDRVGVLLYNSVDYVALYFAIARIGAIAVRLNFRLAPAELEYILNDSGATVLCLHSSLLDQVAPLQGSTNVENFVVFPDSEHETPAWARQRPTTTAETEQDPTLPRPSGTDPVMLMYTSGTTGRPKGAVWSHENTMWLAIIQAAKWSYTHDTVSLTMGPLYHAGAFEDVLLPALLMHGTGVTLSSGGMSVERVVTAIEKTGATEALLYPFMLYDFLRADFDPERVRTLRRIVAGGDPIMPWALSAFDEKFPHVEIVQGYGLTEGGTMSTVLDHADRHLHPDSVGRPMPMTEVKVMADLDSEASAGEVGEVWVRCPTVSQGYWNKPEATAETFIDGWCRTGDLGRVTDDGYLVITGRAKDMIRSGGENIYPAEVEAVLSTHPDVSEVAVVAVPDDKYIEVGCAVVVSRAGTNLEAEELRAFARERLAGYKVPKHYRFVDKLPSNASGKILKHVLRDTYRDIRADGVHA